MENILSLFLLWKGEAGKWNTYKVYKRYGSGTDNYQSTKEDLSVQYNSFCWSANNN